MQFLPSSSTIYRGHVVRDTCPHQLILLHVTSHADLSEELIGPALVSPLAPASLMLNHWWWRQAAWLWLCYVTVSHKSSLEVIWLYVLLVRGLWQQPGQQTGCFLWSVRIRKDLLGTTGHWPATAELVSRCILINSDVGGEQISDITPQQPAVSPPRLLQPLNNIILGRK